MASKYQLRVGAREAEVDVEEKEGGAFHLRLNGVSFPASLERIGESARYSIIVGNRPYDFFAEETPHGYHIVIGSRTRYDAWGKLFAIPAVSSTGSAACRWYSLTRPA
jgi:hypothetical protein